MMEEVMCVCTHAPVVFAGRGFRVRGSKTEILFATFAATLSDKKTMPARARVWSGRGGGSSRRTADTVFEEELVVTCFVEAEDDGGGGLSNRTIVVLLIGEALSEKACLPAQPLPYSSINTCDLLQCPWCIMLRSICMYVCVCFFRGIYFQCSTVFFATRVSCHEDIPRWDLFLKCVFNILPPPPFDLAPKRSCHRESVTPGVGGWFCFSRAHTCTCCVSRAHAMKNSSFARV